MGFKAATIETKPAHIGTGVKVSLKKIRNANAKMSITITADARADFNWSDGDKIEVLIGDDEHHGLIRLRKNNSVGKAIVNERKAVRGTTYLTLSLGHQPAFVNQSEAARWCKYEKIDEGWIEVVLPSWADQTAPIRKAPAPAHAPRTNALSRPTSPAPSVTAALMGDPEPGRREKVEKMTRKEALQRVGTVKV